MTTRLEEGNDYGQDYINKLKKENMIASVFTVTDYFTQEQYEESIYGFGSEPIEYLRKKYPKFSKFVLDGFEIGERFLPLNTKTFNSK